jgi:ribosome-associated protein
VVRNLLSRGDRRLTRDGVLVIKAQRHRSQEKNRTEALQRLRELVAAAAVRRPPRIPTRPTRASKQRRLESKTRRGRIKSLRRPVTDD